MLFRVRVLWLMFLGLRIVGTEWGNESERYYCCYCSYFSMSLITTSIAHVA